MITLTDVICCRVRQTADLIFGLKQSAISQETVIHPKHPNWRFYVEAKREASLWLTCRRLLRLAEGQVPTRKEARLWAAAGETHHARPGKKAAKKLASKAQQRLRKLQHQLEHRPARFEVVEGWKQTRSKEVEHARS